MRVGIVQIEIALGDRKANQERVRRWMSEHMTPSEEVTVIALPEMWDVGYAIEDGEKVSDPNGAYGAGFLGELAQQYGVWFAGGSVLAGTGSGYVNRAQAINPKGELVNEYDKVHLVPMMNEDKYLLGGDGMGSFNIGDVPAAQLICYDLRFCEWIRYHAVKGAQVLFISAEWPTIRIEHWRLLLRARAIENMMYVVASNRVGNSKNTDFGGCSAVIDPWGEVLYEGGDGEEGVFVSIDTKKIIEIRNHLKVFEFRRPDIYSRYSC